MMGYDGGWRRRSWRYLFESRWLKLRQDEITLPSRGDIVYTVVVTPGRQDARLRWNMTVKVSLEQAQ